MNKKQLKQNIEKMEAELAKMKLELEKSDKVELEQGNYIPTLSGDILGDSRMFTDEIVKCGGTRATKELAEIASKNMVARNKLEAYAMQLDPEWRDEGQTVYYIYTYKGKYMASFHSNSRYIGMVYMSKQAAVTLCQWLNEGRISLDKE